MLPAGHRLTSGESFRAAVRRGRRSGAGTLVLHLHPSGSGHGPPLVGFVVSRAVGPAVVRNRVKRRLRHLVRERLAALPEGSVLVVRAQPSARTATYAELGHDLDRGLGRLLQEVG